MNVYMHEASATRSTLRLGVRVAFVAVLVTLAGWAVRANMISRETAPGKGRGTGSGTSGSIGSGNAALSPANEYREYFRFDPGSPSLGLANAICALFQSPALNSLNDGDLEFLGLSDGSPREAVDGWLNDGIMDWHATGNPPLPRTSAFLTTGLGDENNNQVLSLGTRTGTSNSIGGRVSLSGITASSQIQFDSNCPATLAMLGAGTQGPLQITAYDNATGFSVPTSAIKTQLIPEPSPATLAAAGFLVLIFRFNAQ